MPFRALSILLFAPSPSLIFFSLLPCRKRTVFPSKLKNVCKVRAAAATRCGLAFIDSARVFRSSRTMMTKGRSEIMHRARPLRRQPVYDRGNNSTLAAGLCIRQDDNEGGACKKRDTNKSFFVIGTAKIPIT